jgi:hypothetical protein
MQPTVSAARIVQCRQGVCHAQSRAHGIYRVLLMDLLESISQQFTGGVRHCNPVFSGCVLDDFDQFRKMRVQHLGPRSEPINVLLINDGDNYRLARFTVHRAHRLFRVRRFATVKREFVRNRGFQWWIA